MFKFSDLAILNLRRVKSCPSHFSSIKYSNINKKDKIALWIEENLEDRYCVATTTSIDNNQIKSMLVIGFENPLELTLFCLSCPLIER